MTSKYETYFNALWLITNVTAVVGIVTANKLVFSHFKFHFGTLLTVIHFTFTSLCLELGMISGLIERKSGVSWWKVLPLSAAFCGFVVLTNLSLQYNSVGFYQVKYQGNFSSNFMLLDGQSHDHTHYGIFTVRFL